MPTEIHSFFVLILRTGGYSNGAPRSKLLETKHTPYYYNNNNISSHNHNLSGQFSLNRGSGLERSQSDAQERSSTRSGDHRRQASRQSNASPSENRGRKGSRESEEARRKRASKSMESLRENGAAVPVIPVASGGSSAGSKSRVDYPRPPSSHSSSGAHVNAGYSSLEIHKSSPSTKTTSASTTATTATTAGLSMANGTAGMVSSVVPDNRGSNKSSARSTSTTSPSLTPSATDSMKLLSKNKTDDQKTTSPVASIMVEKKEDDLGSPLNYQRYEYGGELYTMPSKGIIVSDKDEEDFENPIVSRMKQMVLEKTRSNPTSPRTEVVNTTKSSSFENGVFEEVTKITKVTRSEVIETAGPEESSASKEGNDGAGRGGSTGGQATVDLLDGLVLPDIVEGDNKKKSQPSSPELPKSSTKVESSPSASPTALSPPPAAPTSPVSDSASKIDASNTSESGVSSPTSPVVHRPKDVLSPRASDTTDDINKAGKNIWDAGWASVFTESRKPPL